MRNLLTVARHEFLSNVRKRSFLFAAIGGPLFTIILMGVIILITVQAEMDTSRFSQIGVVDQAGVIVYTDDPTASVEQPPEVMFIAYNSPESAADALARGTISAYFILPPDYLSSGSVRLFSSGGAGSALTDLIDDYLLRNIGRDLDPTVLDRLIDPAVPTLRFLDTGRTVPIDAVIGIVLFPIMFVVFFMIAIQSTSGYLMSSVVEEKANRIMEILITSVTPMQLLGGKIIGLGLLGLVQIAIWMGIAGAGSLVVSASGSQVLSAIVIAPDLVVMALVYFILGYGFFAVCMAVIGVVVGTDQESRQYAGLFVLPLAAPLFAMLAFLTDPNGVLVTALSLVPLTAPTSMLMRMSFAPVPPLHHLIAIGGLLVLNIALLWGGARIFRLALLMYGKKLSPRQLIALVRRPASAALVTRAGETAQEGA
jgi:ABC-2 type transport system permease protein